MILNQLERSDFATGEAILIPCTSDEGLNNALKVIAPESAAALSGTCEADDSYSVLVNGKRLEIIGVKSAKYASMQAAVRSFVAKNGKRIGARPFLYLDHLSDAAMVDAAVSGAIQGTYNVGLYKTDTAGAVKLQELNVVANTSMQSVIDLAADTANTQKSIYELVNAPSNHKTPQTLADWALSSGTDHDYDVTVIEEDDLLEQGFHALLAVNRGSEFPARFVICDYNPAGSTKTVALVGKGVTFDTGGLSIKPSNNMHLMKSDMGGAAAVLGAVELIAKRKLPVRVIGFVPTTDNSVDAKAIKPGDVISSYSGKTIEVLNTDAEGRLILADALAYTVKNYEPDVIIDLATLTGSVVRALGSYCAGLFTHNDSLANDLIEAGASTGERLWRLPMWEEYGDDMRSEIADIKNLSEKPTAGAITAAKFLEVFTDSHEKWAHIDIAGTAFKVNGISKTHTSTAYGVRLLHDYISTLK